MFQVQELGNTEATGDGKLGLILVEGAEGIGPESHGGSNVQHIQSAGAKETGLGSGKAPGKCEGGGGNGHDAYQAYVDILGERKKDGVLL